MIGLHRRLVWAAGAAALAGTLGGCGQFRAHQGFVLDQVLVDSIQPGIDNRDSVARTLGRPTFTGEFDDRTWYYLSRDTRQFAFRNPRAVEQTLLAVRFDDRGNVVKVERSGLEQIARIDPMDKKTPTLGRSTSFFSELFGNIGRVGATGQGGSSADNPNGD